MSTNSQFEYQPLTSARCCRLLRLIPDEQELRLFLVEFSIEEAKEQEYLALSYTWGSPEDKVPIDCGSRNYVMIPRNLYSALNCLAREPWQGPDDTGPPLGLEHWIWADAVCINQLCLDERSQQVQLMQDIYKGASCVMVWLGQQNEGDKRLIDVLRNMHKTLTRACKNGDLNQVALISLKKSGQIPEAASEDWKIIGNFYRGPWFSRKWVIQEVACAKQMVVMKGPRFVPWDAVCQLPELLSKTGLFDLVKSAQLENALRTGASEDLKLNGVMQPYFMSIQRIELRRNRPLTLLDLLYLFRDSGATDPKDHLFALVGISSDRGRHEYTPDYRKELSELYRSFAWTTIVQSSSLQILSVAGLHRRISGLPSWVPDWTVSPEIRPYGKACPHAFYASGPTNAIITYDIDDGAATAKYNKLFALLKAFLKHSDCPVTSATPGYASLSNLGTVLTVLGKAFDIVENLGVAHTTENILPILRRPSKYPDWVISNWTKEELQLRYSQLDFGEMLHEQAQTFIRNLPHYPHYIAGGSTQDAFWRTLICNTTSTGERAAKEYHGHYQSWLAMRDMMHNPVDTFRATSEKHSVPSTAFDKAYNVAIAGRQFFTTIQGYVGLAPSEAKKGDLICIIRGANVPFVLRKMQVGYALIGECYCHGIMYGEAMQRSDLHFEEFSLR